MILLFLFQWKNESMDLFVTGSLIYGIQNEIPSDLLCPTILILPHPTLLVSVPMNPKILLINDTLTVHLGLEQKSMCIHKLYLSMTILMRSKRSNCHLTLNTFMSIVEHVKHLKVVSVLYSLEVKPSFLRKSLTF